MAKKEKFQDNTNSTGNSSECVPSTKVNPTAIGKGIINGVSSFLGWGDLFDSIGGEDQTKALAKQAEQLQTITPQLIMRIAKEQSRISDLQMNNALNVSKLAILQTQYSEKVLENGTGIDKLIIVMSIAALTVLVLLFTIIR